MSKFCIHLRPDGTKVIKRVGVRPLPGTKVLPITKQQLGNLPAHKIVISCDKVAGAKRTLPLYSYVLISFTIGFLLGTLLL